MTSSALTLATSSALSTTVAGPMIEPPSASTVMPVLPAIAVRLNGSNFMLWKALCLPNLAGARLHGFLDGSAKAPPSTIKMGTGDAAVDVTNPDYAQWWTLDQKNPEVREPHQFQTPLPFDHQTLGAIMKVIIYTWSYGLNKESIAQMESGGFNYFII